MYIIECVLFRKFVKMKRKTVKKKNEKGLYEKISLKKARYRILYMMLPLCEREGKIRVHIYISYYYKKK